MPERGETRPLAAQDTPGVTAVSETTLRALEHLAANAPPWTVRLLFGTRHSMTMSGPESEPPVVVAPRGDLAESTQDLERGLPTLATDAETRWIVQKLGLPVETTVVYLVPIVAHGALGGTIVIGVESGLHDVVLDGLQAIAVQSGKLLETLQVAEGIRQREAGFRALVQNASDILLMINPSLTIVDLAPTASSMLGYRPEDLLGEHLSRLLHPDDVRMATQQIGNVCNGAPHQQPVQWRLRRNDGSLIHVEVVANNLMHDPGVAGIVLSARDISERKALEARILHRVLHDELTGLPNRTAFMKLLENAVDRCRNGTHSVAVLFLDLDRFKVVNDSLGHEAGDRLLIQVARRLRESVRPEDVVARLSGDEFVVMIDNISSSEPAIDIARKILHRLKDAIVIDSHDVFVSTSIGIAVAGQPDVPEKPSTLLKHADLAMYASKNNGRSSYSVYHPVMTEHAVDRLTLEMELRYAIANNQLQVFYQPLVELKTGRINHVEALVRWMHPTRGLLLPDTFITLAEETGLIEPIGMWVLEEACKQGRRWEAQRAGEPPLHINVNLSVRQFRQPDLVHDVARTLASTGAVPQHVTLEITESVAFDDADAAVATMLELKSLGLNLALDDFGTGYSALNYLRRFPVDGVKIDRTFVESINFDEGDMAIVKAVIAFAKTRRLQVTAEGVETPDQMRQLKQLGCDLGQGFYFATPLPGMDLALDYRYATGRLSVVPPEEDGPIIQMHAG